jgi:hypothetical protein
MSSLLSRFKLNDSAFNLPAYLKVPFRISFLLSSAITLTVLIFYFSIQPVIPLFYSLAEPTSYLAPREWLFLFPVFSFSLAILHMILIRVLYHHEKIIPILFAWATIVIQILTCLVLFRILFIIS